MCSYLGIKTHHNRLVAAGFTLTCSWTLKRSPDTLARLSGMRKKRKIEGREQGKGTRKGKEEANLWRITCKLFLPPMM